MSIQKALIMDYAFSLTEGRTRRSLLSDRMTAVAGDNFELRTITLLTGEQVALVGLSSFLIIKSNGPLQININNLGFMPLGSFFAQTGALGNVTIFNSASSPTQCFICSS